MKFLPFFSIFLFLIPDSLSNTPEAYEKFLDDLNQLRSDIANEDGVGAMYKLIYDSSLEKFAANPQASFSGRSFSVESMDDTRFFRRVRKSVADYRRDGRQSKTDDLEAVAPFQKKIGCVKAGSSGYRCVLTPNDEFKLWIVSQPKSNAASYCNNEYRNYDGICAYVGLKHTFETRLRNIRRTVAKKYGIMEMYAVYLDSDIESETNPIDLTKKEIKKMGFGYFKLPSYEISEKELETKINDFLKTSDMEKSKGYGQLISPSATFSACQWDKKQKCFQCLIGPVYSSYPWKSKAADPRKILKTDCPNGYYSFNELCLRDQHDLNYFVRGVNTVRRMAAKFFDIPAEREMIRNDSLSSLAQHYQDYTYDNLLNALDKLELRYSFSTKRVRWGLLSTSELFTFLIEWTQKSDSDKDGFYKNRFFEEMEFLNPNVKEIGCSLHKESEKLLCLMSLPEKFKKFERFDNSKKKAPPGSACPAHHNSKDGLCVDIGNRDEFLELVNSFRKNHANTHNITDMHELLWNDDLVKIAESATWSEPETPKTASYRFVLFNDYRLTAEHLKSEMDALKKLETTEREDLFKKIRDSTMGISELVEPLQKFIGCTYKDQEIAYGLICVIGPCEKVEPWRLENRGIRIVGTKNKYLPFIPGSNCSSGYSNTEGLCTAKNSSAVTLFGNQEDFIKDLNEYRRKVAKQFNVNAMFELYWSKDLDTMLSVLEWDAMKWPLAQVSFRYLRFKNYNSVLDKLPDAFDDLKKKSQKERRVEVYEKEESAGPVELLEPQQHMIACQLKKSKNSFEKSFEFVVCLLGPVGQMEMWSLNQAYHTDRAAFCGESYHFYQKTGLNQTFVPNDGLCSKTPDSKISYFGTARYFLEQANLVRKDRARRYALPRFMKLAWDQDLVESAKTLQYDSKSPPNLMFEPFRWMKLPHYLWHKDTIKGEFFDHITFKDKDLVKQWIHVQKSTSLGILELFGLGQEKIGCAKRNTTSEMFILCLLGPQSRFELIPLEKSYKRGLPEKEGRECPSGFWSDGGLCTPNSEKPPPKKRRRRTTTTTTTNAYSTTTTKAKKSSDNPSRTIWNFLTISIIIFFFSLDN